MSSTARICSTSGGISAGYFEDVETENSDADARGKAAADGMRRWREGIIDPPSPEFQRLLARLHLEQWLEGVELQRSRINEPTPNWRIEGPFFAFALRQLYRSAELARACAGDAQV